MYEMSHYNIESAPRPQYSPLEQITYSAISSQNVQHQNVQQYAIHSPAQASAPALPAYLSPISHISSQYSSAIYQQTPFLYHLSSVQREYHFIPDTFLQPGKEGMFVGSAEEIRPCVEETFAAMFGEKFPIDIKISLLDAQKFRQIAPAPGTIGLSINRRKQGLISEIFVMNDTLGRVLLTVGHELGHVLTETLEHKHDEEAKAYAFSLAWMRSIKEHNIAGLAEAIITENPAQNGLHDLAFFFVEKMIRRGLAIRDIWRGLVEGKISIGS